LLIKYVDIHRSYWLKTGDHYAEQLYNDMAEVFSTWYKSKVRLHLPDLEKRRIDSFRF